MGSVKKAILDRDVIQANPLVRARKEMNLTEMRLFVLGLQDVEPHIKNDHFHDLDFRETVISHSELIELFGSDNNGNISNLKRQAEKAYDNKIKLSYADGGFGFRHIYKKLDYKPQQGLIIQFDDEIKPYVLEIMNQPYTKYKVKAFFSLSSTYAWRILESLLEKQGYFKQGLKEIFVILTVEEVRFRLNIAPNLYAGRIDNLRKFILDLPIAEINEKTDYMVRYEVIKTGRKVTGFKFFLRLKEKALLSSEPAQATLPPASKQKPGQETAQEAQPTPEEELERLGQTKLFKSASEDGMPETLRPFEENGILIAKLSKHGILPESAEKLIAEYGSEQVEANLKYATAAENKHGKKSMAGWIINCVKQDYAAAARIAESLSKQEAERERAELLARLEPLPKIEIDPNDKRTVKEQFADLNKKLRRGV